LSDYEKAINEKTAVILKVHPSNYRIIGFTASPPLPELVELARRRHVILYEDAGSGAVADLSQIGLGDEPVIGESILAGVDVVTFSGDKLLGGPQAGIIAGKRELIETLRKDPLYRALRVSKLIYAALGATLEAHLAGRAIDEIPVMRMLAADIGSLEQRCRAVIGTIENSSLRAELTAGQSAVGGGAAPAVHPDSPLIALEHLQFSANELLSRLRSAGVPVIARIVNEKVVLDLRTVGDEEAEEIVAVLNAV
jgi:L-seryl-tRNA(Ser) seleniumtransferase